jgi:hypothetical protein
LKPYNEIFDAVMVNRKALRHLLVLVLFGLGLLTMNAFAADKVLEASQMNKEPVSLTEYFSVLEDPSTTLTLADVQNPEMAARFKSDQTPAASLNYGFTKSAYWLRLQLHNTADDPAVRLLEISTANLASVQLHQVGGNGVVQSATTGFLLPFATRPYQNRYFVFPLTLPASSEQVIYLRLHSSSLEIPARLWAPDAFHEHEVKDYMGQAWYFGIATSMILFNLLLFIALRDVVYLQYVAFVAFLALGSAAVTP